MARDADLVVHECTYANRDAALGEQWKHSTPADAAWVATTAGARRLLINHFSSRYDDPNELSRKLLSAPAGSTVDGVVYWDVYRGLVTNVVLLNPATGTHLAQWNIWQPGDQLP